jgi:hypothetical protein
MRGWIPAAGIAAVVAIVLAGVFAVGVVRRAGSLSADETAAALAAGTREDTRVSCSPRWLSLGAGYTCTFSPPDAPGWTVDVDVDGRELSWTSAP